ncbi:MAG: DUF6503 family protein [Acidobacteriota bacterium]
MDKLESTGFFFTTPCRREVPVPTFDCASLPSDHPRAEELHGLLLAAMLLALLAAPAVAQNSSDLFMVSVQTSGESVEVSAPVRLTDRDGYDNQPAFSPDGRAVYYSSMRGEQTDIWAVEVQGMKPLKPRAVFETPESEYSPTPMPSSVSPEPALSVVRVEEDGSQRLWRLPLSGGEPSLILPAIKPVGYHAWLGDELALFVLDEPHRLVRTSASRPNQSRTVASDIGRALHRIPGEEAFSFMLKSGNGRFDGWQLTRLDGQSDGLSRLASSLEGREDVTWSPDGSLWSADGTRLMRWNGSAGGGSWQEVADLGSRGILGGITRLAFDAAGERLVLVAGRLPAKVRRLEIVDRAIARHGGDRFTSSDTSLKVCSRSGCFDARAKIDGDRFFYDVRGQRSPQGTRRVVATHEGVQLFEDGREASFPATGEQGLRDWAMARVYFPFLPYRLNDPSVLKQDLGQETWGKKTLHKVRVTFEAGSSTDADDVYLYWFDADTAQLVQFAYSYGGNPGGIRFRQLFNERRIGGLVFFDQKNLGAEGEGLTVERLTPESVRGLRHVSTVTFEDIEVQDLK